MKLCPKDRVMRLKWNVKRSVKLIINLLLFLPLSFIKMCVVMIVASYASVSQDFDNMFFLGNSKRDFWIWELML